MWSFIKYYAAAGWGRSMSFIEGLDRQQWLVILVCVTIAGFMVLQGFGSKRRI